ncbi:MAG: hypothetical protein A2207_03575 [Candidatus Yanofskybacteria bacterium RIFOXYA1_FULL_44_17]|nr:MAG: hypothetical protein A2207_03575 [Candidatus Yanofskybacteria bacterium RIFOXYA1_FULL_44_17]OGN36546.1 MAG: hypothetical protein A2241_02310 [Candidatus Yanofskybacteria bacterium RIFOXYA2_FULL_45_28]
MGRSPSGDRRSLLLDCDVLSTASAVLHRASRPGLASLALKGMTAEEIAGGPFRRGLRLDGGHRLLI